MIAIIPKPYKIIEEKGLFAIAQGGIVSGDFDDTKNQLVTMFASAGVQLSLGDNGEINFIKETDLAEEEYILEIKLDGIKIFASSEKGAFYAIQSIRQMSQLDTLVMVRSVDVQCCYISDKPRFARRSFMLDEARHFFGKDTVKEFLEMMALHKLNLFHWHLSEDQGWRIEIKKYPLLTTKGSIRNNSQLDLVGYPVHKEKHDNIPYGEGLYYTQEDIKEIVKYAKNLHIDIVPEIDMPGHFVAGISCYPEISCEQKPIDVSNRWGILDDIGCVGGDKFIPFVKDVIDEVTALFPYEYFHIGGDEVPKGKWKKCPKCQAKIKELGLANENELQGWFNNQILEYLKTKGKKTIGWNEILDASTLANETIVQWWIHGYSASGAKQWLEKGNKIVLSPCKYLYLDHLYSMKDLKMSYDVDLEKLGIPAEFESQVLGIEAPLWTEYVRDRAKLHFNSYPRIQALAEINWTSKENKNYADFDTRLQKLSCIMDSKGIGYAPRSIYNCRGFSGMIRRAKSLNEWQKDTYIELKRSQTIK